MFAYVRKQGKLNEPAASFILRQIVAGLTHIQSKNCAHRDIKLENVLFFSTTELKIVDFGLAAEMRAGSTQLSMICGSLLYVRRRNSVPPGT